MEGHHLPAVPPGFEDRLFDADLAAFLKVEEGGVEIDRSKVMAELPFCVQVDQCR